MCQETTSCSNTQTCQTALLLQANAVLSARVAELERELSRSRAETARCYGLATELAAVSEVVKEQVLAVRGLLSRQPEVLSAVPSIAKLHSWALRLGRISQLATFLRQRLSVEQVYAGMNNPHASCCRSTMPNYLVQGRCSEQWMASHLKSNPDLRL